MSRIGRLPVPIPSGVKVRFADQELVAQGPKGEQSVHIHPEMKVEVGDKEVRVLRPSDAKRHRSLHGLSRTLVHNTIQGVATGFSKKLEIRGVGYKAEMRGHSLVLALGYSHPIEFPVPTGIEIQCESPTLITVRGIDKQRVG